MAELAADGKFHPVDDAEADAVIEDSSHAIMHNEALGRVIRNMYERFQVLEKQVAAKKGAKRSVSP